MEASQTPAAPAPAAPKLTIFEKLRLQELEKQAANPSVSKRETRGPATSVPTRGGTFSFVGMYVNTPWEPKQWTVTHNILPVNIPELARKPAPMVELHNEPAGTMLPMYVPASADGKAIALTVEGKKGDAPERQRRPVHFSRLPTDKVQPKAILSTREPVLVTEKITQRSRPLEPFTLVKVNNAFLEHWTKKDDASKEGVSISCDLVQPEAFADFNGMPVGWRIAQIFRLDTPELMDVSEVSSFATTFRNAFAAGGSDAKALRKAKTEYIQARFGALVPVALLSANRPYQLDVLKTASLLDEQVLPEFRPLPMVDSPQLLRTSVMLVKPDIFRPTTGDRTKVPDQLTLAASFSAHVYSENARDPSKPVFAQYYPEVTMMAGFLAHFPVAFPELVHRLFQTHPVPFHTLAEVSLAGTLDEGTIDSPDQAYLQGYVRTRTLAFFAELARYLQRYAIPCTRDFVKRRYEGEWAAIDTPNGNPKYVETLKLQRESALGKWMPKEAASMDVLLDRDGCACLDGPKALRLPPADETGVSYYALNLFEFSEAPPKLKKEDKEFLLPAVDLTPATGDAWILKTFPRPPASAVDWLQKNPTGMPFYLFFAVRDAAPENPELMAALTTTLRQHMFPSGPVPGAENLPPTVGHLRRRLACELAGLPYVPASAAAAAATSDQGEKHPRVESEEEEEEPKKKRPRILELAEEEDPMEEDAATGAGASGDGEDFDE
jgi:hypothetical protein